MGSCCCKSKEVEEEISRKISVVGNGEVGKTCLIKRYLTDEFDEDTPHSYIPSALQVDEKVEELKNGKKVHLFIYDLGGRDTFKHLTRMNYPRSDAALICFGIDDKESLKAVKEYWIPEMIRICPGIPILLVGLKKDKRDETRTIENFVRESDGHSLAKSNNLVGYVECSSLKGDGVKTVFATIAREAAKRQNTQKAAESV
ncbi:unnamed protein product [Candidula unifasciata]|uniref:Uncharacterized protein n=1 Tax=Candidula unifasciata TaxID=100452 RepID=A0A8S3YQJ7_9EUPU|nr:unnamed protein product [Candidula unifasciata]